jgi:DNA-binding NarL/FixJ family response regulator
MDGIAIARRLRNEYPSVKILAISAENTCDTVRALLDVGIDGFISKQTGHFDEIINAIHTVMGGENYYGSDIASIIYRIYLSKKKTEAALPELTTREKEIITWCSEGLIAKEIADRLGISVKTVHNHKNNIFAKLGIGNTMEMVKYAMKHNIIG